jgi:predicted ArsR family transcriptional regulator
MVYRLTKRTHDLFPSDSNELTLQVLNSAKEIYGPNAAEKLLLNVFERKTKAMKTKITGATVAERAQALAKQRDSEGYMSEFSAEGEHGGSQIFECHSPIMNLLDNYPIVARLEQDMFEAVLGTSVRREETRNSGQYECAFYFAI